MTSTENVSERGGMGKKMFKISKILTFFFRFVENLILLT